MNVELIDTMGSDLSVVNAARVSFDKESEWEYEYERGAYVESDGKPTNRRLSKRDIKLINYLANHNHWTPFGHIFASFRIKAPLFVARQLGKHQVGLVWNEVSRRYVDSEPEFYTPPAWREKVENVKQGSGGEITGPTGRVFMLDAVYQSRMKECLTTYQTMLDYGVCAEQARMVLPQSMYTEWIWSGSVAAFARVVKLRLDPHTQLETRQIAEKIDQALANKFPYSWKALTTHG